MGTRGCLPLGQAVLGGRRRCLSVYWAFDDRVTLKTPLPFLLTFVKQVPGLRFMVCQYVMIVHRSGKEGDLDLHITKAFILLLYKSVKIAQVYENVKACNYPRRN